jgi:hypothetical protein
MKSLKNRQGPFAALGEGASAEAKRLTAAILEVLAGLRTPSQAAEALGMALPRYYLLEARAVVLACERRSAGHGPSPQSALASLQRECEQLRQELTRQQTLVRAAQRTMGLAAPAPNRPPRDGKKHRQRRPAVRALKAVARLAEKPSEPETLATAPAPASV